MSGYITLFCIGSWGLLSGLWFSDLQTELFLGMAVPWLVGVFTVISVDKLYRTKPAGLTQWMTRAFLLKMIIYGAYVTLILGFYSFTALPFILSFAGYFVVLHISEALYFRAIFKAN